MRKPLRGFGYRRQVHPRVTWVESARSCSWVLSMGLYPDIECRHPRLAQAVDRVLEAGMELTIRVCLPVTRGAMNFFW